MNVYGMIIIQIFLSGVASGWVWVCKDSFCTRQSESITQKSYPNLESCKLVCDDSGILWPYPTSYEVTEKKLVYINPSHINFEISAKPSATFFLNENLEYFRGILLKSEVNNNCTHKQYRLNVTLVVLDSNVKLKWNTTEEYTLTIETQDNVKTVTTKIVGENIFGVRHGLETLLQLIVSYSNIGKNCFATARGVKIYDVHVYVHRGLLLDTGRNFLSVDVIKRNILAMAASKLNVLHWHITDSQSFPLELNRLPNMTRYGAYSRSQIYTEEDVKEIVRFGMLRGVRVLLEIDGPSHAGNGWQWGPEAGLGNLAVCVNEQPWRNYCIQPPCGQLNPSNSNLYNVLNLLYKDIAETMPDTGMFHMGGDEVYIPCWNSSEEIIRYIKDKNRSEESFLDLWGEYQKKALSEFDSAVGHNLTSIVLWTSALTQPDVIRNYISNERYIIQTWVPSSDNLPTELLQLGYKLIISTKDSWYLDHGFWGSTSYYNWRKVYENKIPRHRGVLGGEVCMWGELVDDDNFEARVWPRAAAAAERLWSNPVNTSVVAESRFFIHRERLKSRGIKTEAVTPKWCVQNENECNTYLSNI